MTTPSRTKSEYCLIWREKIWVRPCGPISRSRKRKASPFSAPILTLPMPAPSCPRLCCFSIKRKSWLKPWRGLPYFSWYHFVSLVKRTKAIPHSCLKESLIAGYGVCRESAQPVQRLLFYKRKILSKRAKLSPINPAIVLCIRKAGSL